MATYTYTSLGEKVQVVYSTSQTTASQPSTNVVEANEDMKGSRDNNLRTAMVPTTMNYCGNVIYNGNSLSMILLDGEGYIKIPKTPMYYLYVKDHLGNVRFVAQTNGTVKQTNQYYPFGKRWDDMGETFKQPYLYNCKELDEMHDLSWYDYGARMYEPALGRFMRMDPMAEKYYNISPYAYCANNPINAIDPDGKEIIIQYKDNQGKFQSYYFNGFGGKSIKIPQNQFVKDVIKAYLYNASDGTMNNMIKAVTNSKYKIYVRDATDPDVMDIPSTRYINDSGKHIITWQSRKGIITTEGGRQSAATGLEHEFDHAVNAINDPSHRSRVNTYNKQYDTAEEKRVIEGSEAKTARSHGESIRKNHEGKTFDATSPISTKKAYNK